MPASASPGRNGQTRPAATVDYRMRRRKVLADIEAGFIRRSDVCDPHPDLLRVARSAAAPLGEDCPICDKGELVVVAYAFGPRLGNGGRCILSEAELDRLSSRRGRFTIYEVEVCPRCGWNHLQRRYTVGEDIRRPSTPLPDQPAPLKLSY